MKTLYINDKMVTIFDNADFFREMEDVMGIEAVDYIKSQIEELEEKADETKVKVNTDLEAYEADYDSHISAFKDIQDCIDSLANQERYSRKKVDETIQNITKIIDQQY